MNKIFNWFVYSSKDPQKLALTVRGLAVGAVPTVILLLNYFGVAGIGESDLNGVVNAIENAIILGFGTVSAVMTVWGLVRKIYIALRDYIRGY